MAMNFNLYTQLNYICNWQKYYTEVFYRSMQSGQFLCKAKIFVNKYTFTTRMLHPKLYSTFYSMKIFLCANQLRFTNYMNSNNNKYTDLKPLKYLLC